jgi:type VI secretion system protein ImpG
MLNPISLLSIDKSVNAQGHASLTFNFEIDNGVKWQNLTLNPLRMYLHAELPTALALHQLLARHIVAAEVILDNGSSVTPLDPATLTAPGGFSENESLLQGDTRAFRGYELLLEYFVYPEKFLFIDFRGFKVVKPIDPPPSRFSITVRFDRDFPENKPFGVENFKLHCSPAVNLFKQDTEPVVNTGRAIEYLVRADSHSRSYTTHSLISVVGVDRKSGERYVYEPFHTFKSIGKTGVRTYTTHFRQGLDNQRELFITIGGKQAEEGVLKEENLSIEAWCTNGVLPREELRDGSITRGGQDFPDFVMVTNITRPTLPCQPPPGQEYLWVFLSHLGATYTSFSSAAALKSFLKLYEWSHSEGRSRRIEAISNVEIQPVESLFGGSIVRGIEMAISLQESEFVDSGDLFLFGEVLKEFLAQYVSINSFLELVIIGRPSGKEIRWNSLKGKRCPI